MFWEMLSMGGLPYAGGEADDTIKKIKAGYRLPVPDEVKEANWLTKCYNEVADMCWQLDPKKRCNFTDLVKIFETHLSTDEKENYRKMEQKIKNVVKQDVSKEAISFNNLKDNASAKSMNDIEVVYNNPTDEVIVDLEYVDPVVETTL